MNKSPFHEDQSDLATLRAWETLGGECPICGEHLSWHQGIVLSVGGKRVWQCLLCTLLNAATKSLPNRVVEMWDEVRDHVPVPEGYRLVFLNHEWLPAEQGFNRRDPLQVARVVGQDSAPRMWAALHEDSGAISYKNWWSEPGTGVPFLLKETRYDDLGTYLCSKEESATRDHIYERIGLDEDQFEWNDYMVNETLLPLPYIPPETLARVHSFTPVQRRTAIPRIGVVDPDAWQAILRDGNQPLGEHVKTIFTDDGWKVFFAGLRDCENIYGVKGKLGLNQLDLGHQIGYDYGAQIDPKRSVEASLWGRVFGSKSSE